MIRPLGIAEIGGTVGESDGFDGQPLGIGKVGAGFDHDGQAIAEFKRPFANAGDRQVINDAWNSHRTVSPGVLGDGDCAAISRVIVLRLYYGGLQKHEQRQPSHNTRDFYTFQSHASNGNHFLLPVKGLTGKISELDGFMRRI